MKSNNDDLLQKYKTRKVLRLFIILFGILTIVLSILSLTIKLGPGYALIAFVIMTVLTKKRNSIELDKNKKKDK